MQCRRLDGYKGAGEIIFHVQTYREVVITMEDVVLVDYDNLLNDAIVSIKHL